MKISIIASSNSSVAFCADQSLQTWANNNKTEVARLNGNYFSVRMQGMQFLVLKDNGYTVFVQDNEKLSDRIAVLSHANRAKMVTKLQLFIQKNPKP